MLSLFRLLALTPLPLLLAATCQPAAEQRAGLPPSLRALHGTWLHSHEEDQGDTLVYRPNTYKFPPARGRTGFALAPGGRFTQYDIAPTDGLQGHPGTWALRPDNHLRVQLSEPDASTYELVVLKLANQKLYVRRVE